MMKEKLLRPPFVKDEHLEFLEELKASRKVNMFVAAPFLAEEFGLEKKLAKDILLYWMQA